MLLPTILIPVLSILSTQVITASDGSWIVLPSPRTNFFSSSIQRAHLPEERFQVRSKRVVKRQAGGLGGCGNAMLGEIMEHVVTPLLERNEMKLGDVALILKDAVQMATGRSVEVMMTKGELMMASHQMNDTTHCRQKVGDFYTTVYETPIQYDVNDVAAEQIMENIDFGEPLGGSGYPGQQPFKHEEESSHERTARDDGHARLTGCLNEELRDIMQRELPPMLNRRNISRIGDIARSLQRAIQRETGRSVEVMMGKSDMRFSSHLETGSNHCRQRVGEYYTTVYETPVQYNVNDFALEQELSTIDFGEPLGSSGFPGQPHFPLLQSAQSLTALPAPPQLPFPFQQQPLFLAPQQQPVFLAPPQQPVFVAPPQQPVFFAPPQQPIFVPPPQQAPVIPPSPPYYPPNYGAYIPPVVPVECFSGDSIVETREGPKRMRELKTGDEVLSIEESMISFSPILMFLHRDEQLLAQFNLITTSIGAAVKLTNEHLIYVSDCDPASPLRLIKAKDVTTEHCLMTALSPDRILDLHPVTNVTQTFEAGVFAPLTTTGDIIVNDILSSCHSNVAVRTLQLSLFSLYRSLSFLILDQASFLYGLEYLITAVDLFMPVKY